jgi:hypothetical protein
MALYHEVLNRRRAKIAAIVKGIPAGKRPHLVDGLRAFTAAAGEAPEQPWSLGWSAPEPPPEEPRRQPARGNRRQGGGGG